MNFLPRIVLGALACLTASVAAAASYPSKQIELVVAYQPGGGSDNTARAVADEARNHFPQTVFVMNKPGASGSIGWSYVLSGKPDGYKVLLMNPEMLFVPLMGIGKATIDDFQPVARFTDDPSSITVRADAPWNTIEEFIAYAKANPEAVTISNAGNGTIPHLAAAALADSTGATFTHVPYQGSSPAIMGLMAGDVKATTVAYAELRQHVETGKLKTLAVMSAQRLPAIPQVPTFKERGHDLQFSVWRGIGLPKGAPEEALAAWREVARKVYETPAFQKSLVSQNLTLAWADTPEFTADIARQNEAFKTLMKKLNLKP
ncbi:ABC transporter substrate-binding protein [Achromobacter sp. HZ01]|jgi:tripartite-type tricarboxylate transporter receptor subunit TctC|uniref:Bug family tripartite tricarboxylate transporter substrate binding protein n=1 Tax=Achromobacter sp. HZ01 TaxID=1416886 RepID=UPI000DC3CC3B|nr:tripartite tricarboxylate transporter substrate binding protein [Achromobacter sp. HZ01]MBO9327671.1 tripartite tricarboxylate transporter substrate binding protein [Achromobacter xylosoxidans]RAP63241.1 ABC transporter substrate-binding protein [Achromobacter sp. HZ01]